MGRQRWITAGALLAAGIGVAIGCSVLVDPSDVIRCAPDVEGACPAGTFCSENGRCERRVSPDGGALCEEDICDGLDNDCDGMVDEQHDEDADGFFWCGQGHRELVDCDDKDEAVHPAGEDGVPVAAPETCDGEDDDCDGRVDEGLGCMMMDAGPPPVDAGDDLCHSTGRTCEGSTLVTCVIGARPSRLECGAAGCDPVAGACNMGGSCPFAADPLDRTVAFDLCAEDDRFTPALTGACRADGNGPDRPWLLQLTQRSRVDLDLRDVDGTFHVDTLLYVRRAPCDTGAQLDCSDDLRCSESDVSDFCDGPDDVQVRQSKLSLELDAGDYYVITDTIEWGGRFTCGRVELRVTVTPL